MKTLALVGVGKWGLRILEASKKLTDCNIVYLCSPQISKKKYLEDKFIKVSDYKELLSKKDIDGVIIATPTETHFEIASQFLSNGFSVLIEKPVTTSLHEAKKLHTLAQKNNCVLKTDYIYLQNAAFIKISEYINKIGRLRYLEFRMGNKDRNLSQSSILWEWGPHVLSMGLTLLQKKPLGVTCNSFKDIIFLTVSFPDNVFLSAKIGNYFHEDERHLKVICKNGYIIYNEKDKKKLTLVKNDSQVKLNPSFDKTSALERQLREFCKILDEKKDFDRQINLEITHLIECLEKSQKKRGAYQKI
jgi:predicted dehydrogenase